MKLSIITNNRSDEGIYLPLISALKNTEIAYRFSTALWHRADWVIVLGDTWPMLERTITAIKAGLPVAHIHGGDLTGSVDDSIRHAISKLAHLHFPSLDEHARRLMKMGEEPWRIMVAGPLGIYAMPEVDFISREDLKRILGLDDRPIILVIQHPVSTEVAEAGVQMRETMEAVNNPKWQPVVIYPNDEPGSLVMIDVIESYPYKRFKNLPYLQFLSLLKVSACIVGNSSCGLVEAPLFGVPCVNIGSRQEGRIYDKYNSVTVDYDQKNIRQQIENAFNYCWSTSINPYLGYTDGPQRIINKLLETKINKKLLQKRMTY